MKLLLLLLLIILIHPWLYCQLYHHPPTLPIPISNPQTPQPHSLFTSNPSALLLPIIDLQSSLYSPTQRNIAYLVPSLRPLTYTRHV
jgi:hypothetical protein